MRTFFILATGIFIGILLGSRIEPPANVPSRITTSVGPSLSSNLPPQVPRITSPQTIHATVTAYDPYDEKCVGDYAYIWPRRTATGSDAELPGVAADLAVIPKGSKVEIPDIGSFIVDDDGVDMRRAARRPAGAFYWLDVRVPAPYDLFSDRNEARREAHRIAVRYRVRSVDVHITPPGSP